MGSAFFIARRYLFAKKTHNVINVISIISAVGIAIGCAALIIILSVYNGFDDLLRSFYDTETADLLITPAKGKVFDPAATAVLSESAMVSAFYGTLEENVYLRYDDRTVVATAKGIDSCFESETAFSEYIVDGTFNLHHGEIKQMVLGRSVASELKVNLNFLSSVEMYFPSRTEQVSLVNPMASLRMVQFRPSGIVALDNDFDKQYVFVPLEALQSLLEYTCEVSSVEVRVKQECLGPKGVVKPQYQKQIENLLGEGYVVRNRFQQNETVYKLLTYEKLAIYAILIFIVLIVSCNVYGSLNMLVIEKKDDIEVLKAMGADNDMVRRIFTLEGWMIAFFGIMAGILLGLAVCWIQIRFGIIKMPGNFMVDTYPVQIRVLDVLSVFFSVSVIGYIMARK